MLYNEQIIEIEHGSFTPLVRMCREWAENVKRFYSRLAEMISSKESLVTTSL